MAEVCRRGEGTEYAAIKKKKKKGVVVVFLFLKLVLRSEILVWRCHPSLDI